MKAKDKKDHSLMGCLIGLVIWFVVILTIVGAAEKCSFSEGRGSKGASSGLVALFLGGAFYIVCLFMVSATKRDGK